MPTVTNIYPPEAADTSTGRQGRQSYKIVCDDGVSYYGGDAIGPQLQQGQFYDFEIALVHGKSFINKFTIGAQNTPQSPSGQFSDYQAPGSPTPPHGAVAHPQVPQSAPVDPVPANIWIQGITQQAVANGNYNIAQVYQWAVDNYSNFTTRKPVTPFPGQA